jgi:hypothetical protein
MMRRKFVIACILAAGLLSGVARAEVIKPRHDLTVIQTALGEIAMLHTITLMNNAHDVEMLGFFIRSKDGPAQRIPFEFANGPEPLLNMRTGADCMVSSARVLRDDGRLRVVYAHRKGLWFDNKPVSFDVFELVENENDMPGTPPLYFDLKKTLTSKRQYCDVNDALDKEAKLYSSIGKK